MKSTKKGGFGLKSKVTPNHYRGLMRFFICLSKATQVAQTFGVRCLTHAIPFSPKKCIPTDKFRIRPSNYKHMSNKDNLNGVKQKRRQVTQNN